MDIDGSFERFGVSLKNEILIFPHILNLAEGIYVLEFSNGFSIDMYRLIVTDPSIEVEEIEIFSRFSQPEFDLFWRYPPNSFAYYCGILIETSWICDDFLTALLREVKLVEFEFPDYGEVCYPRSSMGHYYDMPAKFFRYNSEEDCDRAGEILEAYTRSVIVNYSGVSLWLSNWRDKHYRSWLFDN